MDPVLYAAKAAMVFTVGSASATYGAFAESATAGTALVSGLAVMAAGVWKLMADHTAVTNERESNRERIEKLEAENKELEARLERDHEHMQRLQIEAAHKGIHLAEVHDLRDKPRDDS